MLAVELSRLEAESSETRRPRSTTCTLAVRNYHDSGNTSQLHVASGDAGRVSSTGSDITSCGHHRRFRLQSDGRMARFAEIDILRSRICADVLGDQIYESLAREGAAMTTAEMVNYTYDQIDQARTELE